MSHQARLLQESQLPLLTDDRFGKFREFMTLAQQTEVVAGAEETLVKNRSRLTNPFDFHRIRIDNPLHVISNEVEPLEFLQRCVRRIAWQPAAWTRCRVARQLRQKAEATIHINGANVFADSVHEDMYAAIDGLVDKLDRQVKKHKEKMVNQHARDADKRRF